MLANRKIWVGKQSKLPRQELEMWREHEQLVNFQLVENAEDAEVIILKDLDIRNFTVMLLRARQAPKVQMVSEPRVVWPPSFLKLFYSVFDLRVFRCRPLIPLSKSSVEIGTLLDTHRRFPKGNLSLPNRDDRLRRAVIVNAHKYSFVKGENYSLRRRSVASLENVDMHGILWNSGVLNNIVRALKSLTLACVTFQRLSLRQLPLLLVPNAHGNIGGVVASKTDLMSKYKVALVIENSDEVFSEKIWHAWFSGCIPVYVGPDLESFSIPTELVVRSGRSLSQIEDSISQALEMDQDRFFAQLSFWLNSEQTRNKWSYEGAVRQMYADIDALIEFH